MEEKTIHSISPGKLILLGEYAVLEGAPAVVTAVKRYAHATIKTSENSAFSIHSPGQDWPAQSFELIVGGKIHFPNATPHIRSKLKFFSAIIETFLQEFKVDLPPCNIEIVTDDFYLESSNVKLGLGSSAALSVALIHALLKFADISQHDKLDIFRQALRAHYRAQGKLGSGIDIAASTFGGALQYQITPNNPQNAFIEPLEMPDNLLMLAVWSGASASTTELVSRVNAFRKQNLAAYQQIMTQMSDISQDGCLAIANGEVDRFLDCVQTYYLLMDELGVKSYAEIITPSHQEIAQLCRQSGTYYKPSGAGGGDLGLVFADEIEKLEATAELLAKSGYMPINIGIDFEGVRFAEK